MTNRLGYGEIVERIFRLLPQTAEFHSPTNELYKLFDNIINTYFMMNVHGKISIEPFKGIIWPYVSLGNLSSYDLFGLTGMIHYSFYYKNRNNYKIAYDIGANIGIDSIILDKFGYEVFAFEPDDMNYSVLLKNIELNCCKNIHTFPKAISNYTGTADFIRVKGNTTANHILGSRKFYGDVVKLKVETITFHDVGGSPDLMKINVEGHEKVIIPSIPVDQWEKCDAFIGIHDEENQRVIFNYFRKIDINIFSQKIGWKKVKEIKEVPATNKEGYIFASKKDVMPW